MESVMFSGNYKDVSRETFVIWIKFYRIVKISVLIDKTLFILYNISVPFILRCVNYIKEK